MRVLFFDSEQYVDFENEAHNFEFRLPILKSGIVSEHSDFVYQRFFVMHGPEVLHSMAVKECESFRPDVLVFLLSWQHQCPKIETFDAIRAMGIRILTVVSDSMHRPDGYEVDLFERSDGFCVMNSLTNYIRYRYWAEAEGMAKAVIFGQGHNVLTEFFRPLDLDRTMDVLILGSLYRRRVGFARRLHPALAAHGISLQALGGNFHDLPDSESGNLVPQAGPTSKRWIPWPRYLAAINSAKVCVCPRAVDDRDVVVGKIFEFLASGAFAVVERTADIEHMTQGANLAMFDTDAEFVEIAREAVGNPALRQAQADAARDWYLKTFDYRAFWSRVMGAMAAPSPFEMPVPHLETHYRNEAARLATAGPRPASREGWLDYLFGGRTAPSA